MFMIDQIDNDIGNQHLSQNQEENNTRHHNDYNWYGEKGIIDAGDEEWMVDNLKHAQKTQDWTIE